MIRWHRCNVGQRKAGTGRTRCGLTLLVMCITCGAGWGSIAGNVTVSPGGDIQAAIDAVAAWARGGAVTLQAGEHVIIQPLKMKHNVTLRGEGTLASKLVATNGIKMITASTNGLRNLTIENLVIVGTNAARGGGIHLVSYEKDHENLTLSSVHVFETGWGVHIKGAKNVLIENCNFSRNGTRGKEGYAHNLYLRRCYSATVRNSVFTNSISANGINISYSKDIHIVDCAVTGNHFRGIRAADTDGFLVHDCEIGENGTVGLLANKEKAVTKEIDWQRNRVFDNGAEGIYARNGATGVCRNNNAYGNAKRNYRLPKSVAVSGNQSRHPTDHRAVPVSELGAKGPSNR